MEFNTSTMKLSLSLVSDCKNEDWEILRDLSYKTWKAANHIVNHCHLEDALHSKLKDHYSLDMDSLTEKEVSAFTRSKVRDLTGAKTQKTASEREIKTRFDLPNSIANTLAKVIESNYRSDKLEFLKGNRSIRSYRRGMPMPLAISNTKLWKEDDEYYFRWSVRGTRNGIPAKALLFKIYLKNDKPSKKNYDSHLRSSRHRLDSIISGEYKRGESSLQIKDKDLIMGMVFKSPVKENSLDPKIVVGVDLGISIPAFCATNDGNNYLGIMSADTLMHSKIQFYKRRRSLQKNLKASKGGKGRGKKLKALDQLSDKERRFTNDFNHKISRGIIQFALKNNAGTIVMEDLSGFGKTKTGQVDPSKKRVLRDWTYFELQRYVKEKAKGEGIKVLLTPPHYTSQTCSNCSHTSKENRITQAEFLCEKCGMEMNADRNAAINISRSK